MTIDADLVEAIRRELPVTETITYLNTGTNGPWPRNSVAALEAFTRAELTEGRITPAAFTRMLDQRDKTRDALAKVFGCASQEVALTHNTTEGINITLMGIDWRAGDEVITASLEHPGVLYPIFLLRDRWGVRIRMTAIGDPAVDPLAALRHAITPRTRAVVLSHVSWSTGMVLPISELAAETHRAGALFICDGAQSAGMVPMAVAESATDAYAISGQKWLCGPDATGGLFVRHDRLGEIQQSGMGYFGVQHGMWDLDGHFVPPPTAARYEVATLHPASLAAFEASVRWLTETIGLEEIYARTAELGQICHAALAAIPGVTVTTPRDNMAGLVHFRMDGREPTAIVEQLREHAIIIRSLESPAVVRVSTAFFNTEAEIARLADVLRTLN